MRSSIENMWEALLPNKGDILLYPVPLGYVILVPDPTLS